MDLELAQKLFETSVGDYDETKHDRDTSGKFSSTSGGGEPKAGAKSIPGNPSSTSPSSGPSRSELPKGSSSKFQRKETYALGASNKAFEHSAQARKLDPADAKAHAEHHRKAYALHKHAASELRAEGRNKAADEHEALSKVHKAMHEHNADVAKHSERISILANKVSSAAIKVNTPKAHKIASRIATKAGASELADAHKKIADLKAKIKSAKSVTKKIDKKFQKMDHKEDDSSPYNPTEKEHKKFSKFASKLAKTARKQNEKRGIFVRPKTNTKESQDMSTISAKLFLSEGAPIGNTNAAKDKFEGSLPEDKDTGEKLEKTAKSISLKAKNTKARSLSAAKIHGKASQAYKEVWNHHRNFSGDKEKAKKAFKMYKYHAKKEEHHNKLADKN